MAIKKFNSIDGFSVGSDTPIAVIDNVANVSANSLVVANKSNLGNVGNITITGGNAGYVLKTDGAGNLSWGIDTATAGGSNSYVQFNEGGTLAGNSNFTFDQANSILSVTNLSVTTNSNSSNVYTTNVYSSNYYSLIGDLNIYAGSGNSSISLTTTGNGTIDVNDTRITSLATPQFDNDAATKKYVDDVAQGLNVHDSCKVATTANIATLSGGTVAYNNGASGVGANLVITGGSITTIDTYSLQNLDRILVKNEANLTWNGIYTWATGGTVLTRATDFDTPAEIEGGDFTFVTEGNVYQNTGWVQTDNVTTIGTDSIEWQQFSGAGTYEAGNGLSLTGTVFSVNVDNTTIEINSDVLRVKANAQFVTPDIDSATGNSLTLSGSGYIQAGNLVTANYFTGTLTTAAQPNITSLGNLTTLSVTNNAIIGGNITGANYVVANYFTGIITTTHQPNIESVGNLVELTVSNVTGVVDFNTTANVSLGSISNLHILGGNSGYVLKTDGSGNLSWGIDTATAGGSNRDVQFNDGGSLGGNTNFTFDKSTSILTLTGNIITSNADLGNLVTANYFSGNGALLTYITGSNVSGNVASAIQSHYANIANNIAGANVSGQVSNALIAGTVYTNSQPNITSLGTLTSLDVTGNLSAGNIIGGNLVTANYFSGNGSLLSSITGANVTGNVSWAITSNWANIANSVSGSNVSGQVSNALIAGTVYTNAQPNITSVGNLSSLTVTGNISAGNISGGNLVTANYFSGDGSLLTNINAANIVGAYSNTNVAAYLPTYTGNVSANYFIGNGATLSYITGSNVSGNVSWAITSNWANTANSISGSNVNGNVNWAITSNWANIANSVTGANVSGQVSNALIAGTVYTNSQPNITSVGTLTGLDVSGNATITGNLTVSGTTEYINVTNLYVKDPIIELGGGANGTPLTTNDGKDRGTLLHYYTTGTVDAFMGWDNSNGEFGFGSNVSVTNEVVTWNSYGNIRAGYFIGDGSLLTNINAANIVGAYSNSNVAAYLPTYTGYVSANYFIGNGATLSYITGSNVNGNVTSAVQSHYANIANSVSGSNVSGNVSDAIHAYYADVANSVSGSNVSGNVSWAITSNWANTANSVSGSNVSGQVSNALIAGTVYTNAQPNITSLGNLSSLIVTGISDLGSVSNVKITGGSTGYVLTTDGYGDLSWEPTSNSGPGFVSIRKDNFVGDGIQTSFSLITVPNGEDAVEVNLNGLIQQSYVYDIVGSNVVFTSPPVSGANIEVTTFGALSITQTDEQILFIDGNSLAGTNNFTFTRTTNTLSTTNLSVSANISAGNVKSDNLLYANGSPYNFTTSAGGLNTEVQFNDSNVFAGSANFTFNKTTNTLSVTNIIANGSGITYITGSNVSGQVGNSLIAGTVYTNAQPNITSVGTLTSLDVSGNATIAGNLTVSGNINYINVDSLVVQDPIIEMGGGANGAPLTTNDGKDRGSLLHYYTTSPIDAFMGWDNSNGEFAFGSNVSVTNEVVTFNNLGNIRANYFIGDGSLLTNINAANVVGAYSNANVANYLPTYTGNVSANYFIGNGATLTFITGSNVSGNVASAVQSHYANIANSVTGSNVSGNVADAVHAYYADVANSVSGSNVSGNVANAVHAYYADVANSVSGSNVSGQVSNALIAGTVYTNAQPNITSLGNLINLTVTGNISAGNISGGNLIIANYFSGDGSLLTNLNSANIGNVANANYANYAGTAFAVSGSNVTGQVGNSLIAGTVYTNAQPNITSLGTLTELTVNGLIDLGSVGNIAITGGTAGYVLTTNGSGDLSWQAAGGSTGPGFVNITKNSFIGNGVQTIFGLTTTPASEASLLVNIDGITQQDAAYSLSGSNVTFSSPPLSGEIVEIVSYGSISIGSNTTVLFNDNGNIGNIANFTFNKSSNTLNVTNIDTSSISFDAGLITVSGSNAGIFSSSVDNINLGLNANVTIGSTLGNTNIQGNLAAGNISTVGNLVVSNTATITNLKVNDFYSNRTPVSVTINTIVDSFPVNKYRSAKYTMRVNSDDGYQAVEVLLIHDGTDSYVTIYGSLSTIGTDIVTLFSNINSGNVRLLANTISANTTVNFVGTYVAD